MALETKDLFTRIRFDPEKTAEFLVRVRDTLRGHPGAALVIDLSAVTYADPAALDTLGAVRDHAQDAGCEVWIDGATPRVYKALYLAKIGAQFRRLQRPEAGDGRSMG